MIHKVIHNFPQNDAIILDIVEQDSSDNFCDLEKYNLDVFWI